MAKRQPKNIVPESTNQSLQLESVVIAHEQELQKLAEGNAILITKNTKLQKIVDNLEERNKLLINERVKLRAGLYTISMRLHEWSWCVPQLKKKMKEVITNTIN